MWQDIELNRRVRLLRIMDDHRPATRPSQEFQDVLFRTPVVSVENVSQVIRDDKWLAIFAINCDESRIPVPVIPPDRPGDDRADR